MDIRALLLEEALSLESHMVRGKTYGDESKRQDRMLWLNSCLVELTGPLSKSHGVVHE